MKFLALTLLVFTSFLGIAQEADFKAETDAIITQFEKTIATLGDTNTTDEEAKAAKKKIRDVIVSINTSLPYHFAGIDTLSTVKNVLFSLRDNFPHGYTFKMNHSKMEYKDIHVDKSRNCYRIIASLKSRFVATKVTTTAIDTFRVDSVMAADSTITTDTVAYQITTSDTTTEKHFATLTFYLTTNVNFGEHDPIKIEAIALGKEKPVYSKKLSKLTQWWVDLPEKWQQKISTSLKFPEVPIDYYLIRVESIREIDLSGLTKSELHVLSQFKNLQELNLSNMEIDTLDFIRDMTGLKALNIANNKLKSIAGVETLPNLEYLNFNNNEVEDLSPVASCKKLQGLAFSENVVENIDALQSLKLLTNLNMENNKIIKIDALRNCKQIKNLNISKNKDIESLEPIRNLAVLQNFNCYNTNIPSLEPLKGMTVIYNLNIGYTKINSLDHIKHMQNLRSLNIAGNVINDFSALNKFPLLNKFYCSATKISDISPFMGLKNLKEFHATHTNFSKSDIQRLKKKFPKCAITYY